MSYCFIKSFYSKKIRKKLYNFCDEQNYINNLINLYIYRYLESKICKKKYNENINKYVGQIINHLKINKDNSNILFSLQNILDIFFFNYFNFNNNYKLLFFYNILKINNEKYFHLIERIERKNEILNKLCKIILKYDINYVYKVRYQYINKFFQLNKDGNQYFLEEKNYLSSSIVPFFNKTFIEDLINNTQNIKDLCIIIFIIKYILSIYKFDYNRILDKVLRKLYIYIKEISMYNNANLNNCVISLNGKNMLDGIKNIKLRDIIYIFYQIAFLKNNIKNHFLFLKILDLVNHIYKHINVKNDNFYLKILYLSNKDIEQLLFLLNKNFYLKFYFIPILINQFYYKLFFKSPSIIYMYKLFKQLYKNNNILFPYDCCDTTYLEILRKTDCNNYFHIFYQTLCIKYLLKRKIFHEDLKHFYIPLKNKFYGINFFIFFKNTINKIIFQSFNLFVSKEKQKYICIKKKVNASFLKYSDNYIYDFSKSKYFYLIYIKRIIKRVKYMKKKCILRKKKKKKKKN
ncbi:conserved Plasmodium protein, unknown function [Plasmodium gallinaceum]|uniref:Uncharacterized protein n=1 Tax=Plasmodium gallinaceum TaxID=5849 RepID=A0A1J1GSE7_PLAGA|nr:conserved Plasmodium protein, unknown function [Plasmodium gallinaceum]CRG95229.1 conserved Plasmodium protein, unknown function [Plasmodium gallinaceum]